MDKIHEILTYWFGHAEEETTLASAEQMKLWFNIDNTIDEEIKSKFQDDYNKAVANEHAEWEDSPRECLALIIIFDQFSRYIFRNQAQTFTHDQKALDLCLRGIERQFDHQLSLIERAFFYFPLIHSENLEMQSLSLRAYQMLVNLAFPETREIFEKFLNYAVKQYEIIRRFNRFPDRNALLGRPSTPAELEFLKNMPLTPDF